MIHWRIVGIGFLIVLAFFLVAFGLIRVLGMEQFNYFMGLFMPLFMAAALIFSPLIRRLIRRPSILDVDSSSAPYLQRTVRIRTLMSQIGGIVFGAGFVFMWLIMYRLPALDSLFWPTMYFLLGLGAAWLLAYSLVLPLMKRLDKPPADPMAEFFAAEMSKKDAAKPPQP